MSNATATGAGFQGGFKALSDLIPGIVGLPLEGEHALASGDIAQTTTGGLLVYWKADDTPTFTDGSFTWTLGAGGLQKTPNPQQGRLLTQESPASGDDPKPGTPASRDLSLPAPSP